MCCLTSSEIAKICSAIWLVIFCCENLFSKSKRELLAKEFCIFITGYSANFSISSSVMEKQSRPTLCSSISFLTEPSHILRIAFVELKYSETLLGILAENRDLGKRIEDQSLHYLALFLIHFHSATLKLIETELLVFDFNSASLGPFPKL